MNSGTFSFTPRTPRSSTRQRQRTSIDPWMPDRHGRRRSPAACRGPPGAPRILLPLPPAAPDTLYALYAAGDGFSVGLYRSDNRGDTFARRSYSNPRPADLNNPPPFDFSKPNILHEANNYNGQQASYDLALTVSPTNIDRVHVGALDTWSSDDGGRTWKMTSVWTEKVGSQLYPRRHSPHGVSW